MDRYLKRLQNESKENANENDSSGSDSENTVAKRARKSFSVVWTFFEKTKDGKYAKCRSCTRTYKTSGNTSNLFDHLKRAHPTWREMPRAGNKIDSFFRKTDTYDSTSERKKTIDNALMIMIASDIQPFSIVEDKGFSNFVKCLDPRYVLPSRTTLRNVHMASLYKDTKNKLQTIISEIKHCAITSDCWTSRANEGYLTVTCHFITEECTLRAAVLSTKKLLVATNHCAENIAYSLRAVLEEWGIINKVTSIVTDNDNTMVKACELLQKRNLPCFAHSLNLVVQDCLAQNNIKEILCKCKRIVTFFKTSTISYEKFKAAQGTDNVLSLLQEVPTRWNSAYRMIERIVLTNDYISSVLLVTSKAPAPLTADELEVLRDLQVILSPFDNATVQASSSTSITVSLIIPLICGLFQTVEELTTTVKTLVGRQACVFLIEKMKKRLCPYEERTVARLATLLDPRFKKEGFRFAKNAELGEKTLENGISAISKACSESAEPSTSKHIPIEPQQPLLKFLHNKIANKVRTNRVDAVVSIRQYMQNENTPTESEPLEYWKSNVNQMAALKICALHYLCIPATSTESERMFSKAGSIISDRRTCLKPKNVDMLLFINPIILNLHKILICAFLSRIWTPLIS